MAATPEARVKAKVVKLLKELGAFYFYPVTGGYGTSGIPDIVGCYRGMFFGIECKAGNKKPTELQAAQLDRIAQCGGIALVVNEDNILLVKQVLAGDCYG